MAFCYEYFNCKKYDCPVFSDNSVPCWERDDTLCNNPCKEIAAKHGGQKNACEYCLYYKNEKDRQKLSR